MTPEEQGQIVLKLIKLLWLKQKTYSIIKTDKKIQTILKI